MYLEGEFYILDLKRIENFKTPLESLDILYDTSLLPLLNIVDLRMID
jgi:hypothetical protein